MKCIFIAEEVAGKIVRHIVIKCLVCLAKDLEIYRSDDRNAPQSFNSKSRTVIFGFRHQGGCVEVRGQLAGVIIPSAMWISKTELRGSGLGASIFIRCLIRVALLYFLLIFILLSFAVFLFCIFPLS